MSPEQQQQIDRICAGIMPGDDRTRLVHAYRTLAQAANRLLLAVESTPGEFRDRAARELRELITQLHAPIPIPPVDAD